MRALEGLQKNLNPTAGIFMPQKRAFMGAAWRKDITRRQTGIDREYWIFIEDQAFLIWRLAHPLPIFPVSKLDQRTQEEDLDRETKSW